MPVVNGRLTCCQMSLSKFQSQRFVVMHCLRQNRLPRLLIR